MTHEDTAKASGWDLHCHTVFSDGTVTPRGMVEQAQQLGLEGLAITDHDTNAGWDQARKAAHDLGMPLLPGTEITAQDGRVSVHMLAYLYDPEDPVIAGLFAKTREARLTRTRTMVERISRDYPITWQDVLDQVKEGSKTTVGRPHIADALVKAGVYSDRSQAFAGVCSSSSPYYLPTPSPTTHQVLAAVNHAGGVLVIAHPGAVSRNPVLLSDQQIAALAREGLGGLEVWHRDNPPEQRRRLLALAQRWGLLVTGGSDWHGQGKPNRMGENCTSDQVVAQIVDRARGSCPVAWKG
ncbi:PHP domain-containing protein [Bifidobacterium asteroides]|uniref:PHP domain-containing protein n=1 Tax=Bifidobacterium asteroides TaxID=1684 RepID=UPI0020C2F100|nr:PHP domain-containing protein [Bifidobacterium asteroides]MCP8613696.1 PHP domain-containing protein [Bifidobacterium asteroides]